MAGRLGDVGMDGELPRRADVPVVFDELDYHQVHQIRALAELPRAGQPQPAWTQLMAKTRRKNLIVCAACHDAIHARQPATALTQHSPESGVQ
jgi:hypothetical protein